MVIVCYNVSFITYCSCVWLRILLDGTLQVAKRRGHSQAMWRAVWLAAPHSHDADGDSPIRFMWSGLQRRTHTMLMATDPSGSCGLACSAALTRCWWWQSHQVHVVWLAAPHSHDADGDRPIRFMWSGLQRRTHTMLMVTVPSGSCCS